MCWKILNNEFFLLIYCRHDFYCYNLVTITDFREKALHTAEVFSDVEKEFEEVQKLTQCSTGCGGCHDKIMDVISEIMAG